MNTYSSNTYRHKTHLLGLGLLSLMLSGAVFSGCIVERSCYRVDDDDTDDTPPASSNQTPPGASFSKEAIQTHIDTNASMSVEAGQGVGVMVEYESGGKWTVTTTCDTLISQMGCSFGIEMQVPETSFINIGSTIELEAKERFGSEGDSVWRTEAGLKLQAFTLEDYDKVTFYSTPGEVVRFWISLNDKPEGRYFYWVGDEIVHYGAPSNPIDLVPSTE